MPGRREWFSFGESKVSSVPLIIMMTIIAAFLVLVIVAFVAIIPRIREVTGVRNRIECPGFKDKITCEQNGCRYELADFGPRCYMAPGDFGYTINDRSPEMRDFLSNLKKLRNRTPYGRSLDDMVFKFSFITQNILRFTFFQRHGARYEVPVQQKFPLLKDNQSSVYNESYKVILRDDYYWLNFEIWRLNGSKLWDTSIGGLVLADKFLQIASYLPSDKVYGLGENRHETFKHDMNYKTWSLFSRDNPPDNEENLYGVHPFYTCLEPDGKSHGVLFLNSNAMEVTLLPAPGISFRTIGGNLDFFFFVGDNPEHVIQLYTSLVGRPIMPPYWALGFQLSRYGYDNIKTVNETITRTRKARIRQEVQFLDIDHMEERKDFTYDNESFAGLPDFIRQTKKDFGLKWIIILDPGIAAEKNYDPYVKGLKEGVFIKRHPSWEKDMFPETVQDNDFIYGIVWPDEIVAFPDYFANSTEKWWIDNIVDHHKTIEFDGLWIDMNEPANFGTNKIHEDDTKFGGIHRKSSWTLKCPASAYENPRYNPLPTERLSEKTLCMDSLQGNETKYRHYDVHSLYGWSQSEPTLRAAQKATGERSLVISRSTYPSSGRYAGHWLGDNKSRWKDLEYSIIGMLEFNLFGIPYVGADVCGFFGNATPELCMRWMQLGAFYPFFRNHNGIEMMDQDPAAFSLKVIEASRTAVMRRYRLNPYLYTLFYRAHVDGNTVVRPLFHEFPKDEVAATVSKQFMWGSALLVSPVLEKDRLSVTLYLPADDFWNFDFEQSHEEKSSGYFMINNELTDISVHARAGYIIPTDDYRPTKESEPELKNITLLVFPSNNSKARGELFIDDGISIETIESGKYVLYTFQLSECELTFSKSETSYSGPKDILKSVVVFRARKVASVFGKVDGAESSLSFTLDENKNILNIQVNSNLESVERIYWHDENQMCSYVTQVKYT